MRSSLRTTLTVWKWKLYGILYHTFLFCVYSVIVCVVALIATCCVPVVMTFCASIAYNDKKPPVLSEVNCESCEKILLDTIETSNSSVHSDWIALEIDEISISLHSIIGHLKVSDLKTNGKPALLWIHGVGGTAVLSMVKSGVLDRLTDTFNVFAIDLPGFGRSTLPASCIHMTEIEYEELLMLTLKKYCELKKLSKVFVMGHSFGAYHALMFAHRYPQLVDRLLLVGPGGIFQTPSKTGPFLSSIFSLGLPMYPLRLLGNSGLLLFNSLLWVLNLDSPLLHYWYQVQASPSLMSDSLVLRFFWINYYTSTWNRPAWKKLLELKMPVALVFGEADNISPPMQGLVASALAGSSIPIYFIGGGWHVPMAVRSGVDFSTIIKHSMDHSATPTACCQKIVKSLPEDVSKLLDSKFLGGIYSVYSMPDCDAIANKYYHEILKLRISDMKPGDKLSMPKLWLVNGDAIKTVSSTEIGVIDEHRLLLQELFVCNC